MTDPDAEITGSPAAIDQKYTSPLRFAAITLAGIFVAEVISMIVIYFVQPEPYWLITLLDATIMVVLIFPVVYYFSFRPLILQIGERERAELQLERQNQELRDLSASEHRQRELAETLSAVSLALTQSLELDLILKVLLDYIGRLVLCDHAYTAIAEDEGRLTLRAMYGFESEWYLKRAINASIELESVSYLREVMTSRQYLYIPDTNNYPGWATLISRENIRSWLGVPMLVNERAIGALVMASTVPDFFTAEHIRLAEVIIAQASVAIQNAWLFEQVRAGHERLQSLSRRLVEVQENERRYIARELHDEASQALTALMFGLRLLEQEVQQPENQLPRIRELRRLTDGVLEDLHRLAMNLRPASLDHLGLAAALEQLVNSTSERYGLGVHYRLHGFDDGFKLPDYMETILYRIIQEGLTNAVRHSQAKNIDVILECNDGRVVVIVEDDGAGFDVAEVQAGTRLGLLGMQERAQMIGDVLQIESKPGMGTTLVMEMPYVDPHLDR